MQGVFLTSPPKFQVLSFATTRSLKPTKYIAEIFFGLRVSASAIPLSVRPPADDDDDGGAFVRFLNYV